MGKHEVGTPKYIANKIKAKGLQKLRWYCQMCQKQCRDENGFKCHTLSESHQRQLLIVADNPDKFIDEFSGQFETGYLELLKRQFGTKRVPANKVYQDYIADRNHLHMNATQWETLTDFVKWLGRQGKCVVDETEKGWFVTYIDRDPEAVRLQETIAAKERMDKSDNEKMMKFLEKQIENGKKQTTVTISEPTELNKDKNQILRLEFSAIKKEPKTVGVVDVFKTEPSQEKRKKDQQSMQPEKKKLSVLESIIKEEQQMLKKKNIRDNWLAVNIIVKLISKSLGDQFYGKKGVVIEVINKYVGVIKLLETNHKLKVDQEHLETVIPNIGKKMKILNGCYLDAIAELLKVNVDKFSVDVRILTGSFRNNVVNNIPYEDISKLNDV